MDDSRQLAKIIKNGKSNTFSLLDDLQNVDAKIRHQNHGRINITGIIQGIVL
jgi:hypothetical protein